MRLSNRARRWNDLAPVVPILLVAVLAAASPATAIDTLNVVVSDPILEPANWSRFDARSGVAGNIRDYFIEPDGQLWLATAQGLQHYDGLHWTTWTTADGLPSDEVSGVAIGPDGTLWISFRDAGVARRDGDDWVTYGLDDGLLSLHISDIWVLRDGHVWLDYGADELGTEVGAISRYDGDTWVSLPVPIEQRSSHVNRMHSTADGALWLTTSVGVMRYQGGAWTHFAEADGAPRTPTIGVLEASDGALWFASLEQGVYRFDGRTWRHYGVEQGVDVTRSPVWLWQTPDGRIWLGGKQLLAYLDDDHWYSYDKEAYPGRRFAVGEAIPGQQGFWLFDFWSSEFFRFDPARAAQSFMHPEGLVGGVQGPDGAVWFRTGQIDGNINRSASPGRRAVRFRDGLWTGYDGDDGFFDGAVYGVSSTTDGDVWYVGLDSGRTALARLSTDGWHFYDDGLLDPASPEPADNVAHPTVHQTEDGQIWLLGGYEGQPAISRFDGSRWTREILAEPGLCEWATDILQTSDGDLWVSCWIPSNPEPNRGGALLRFDGENWQSYTTLDGLSSTYITGLAEWPRGTLQVGTIDGLSSLDIGAMEATWHNESDFDVPRPKPRAMLTSDDGLWFAFMANRFAGVVRYDGKTHHRITMDEGLVDNDVFDLQRSADGALWFTTRGGLSRYDGERWISYGTDRGLPGGGPMPTMQQVADGTMWLDDGAGTVTRFVPPLGAGPPETEWTDAPVHISAEGNVQFNWVGLDAGNTTHRQDLVYEWRLDEGRWSRAASTRELTLTSLRHGKHTIEVRSLDDDGNVDPTPATHTFVVAAPWWLDPWVVAATALFVGLIAVQTGRVVRRDRALQAANEQLMASNVQLEEANREIQLADQRKSQFLASMSHELRTPMNAIIGFTRLVLRRTGDVLPERQRDKLHKVESSADHLLGLINDLLDCRRSKRAAWR